MNYRHVLLVLLLMLLMVCTGGGAGTARAAKDNKLGIDDECYELYQEARKHRNDAKCLQIYKKMVAVAKRKNDQKAICQALSIPMIYYRYHGSESNFFAFLSLINHKAKRYGLDYYYYWSIKEEINYYIETGRSLKALNRVNEIIKNPESSPYYTFSCYSNFADVYVARRDEIHARQNYQKALAVVNDLPNKNDVSVVYLSLARITEVNDTLHRREYLQKALTNSINPTDSAAAMMGLAYMYSNVNRRADFMHYYRRYMPMLPKEGLAATRYDKWYKSNEAYRMFTENKLDSADIMRQSIRDPYMRYQAQADYYASIDDAEMANHYLDSLVTYLRSSQSDQNIADVAELNTLFETDRLRGEAEEIRNKLFNVVGIGSTLFFGCITVILIVVLLRRRKTTRRLHQLTIELQEARDQAIKASKMKDIFIQNMSHEIRTPLNAVSGFAQLLALPAEFFSDEERTEFGQHIQNNTNLLTMLIDDILSLSDVESGNYRMVFDTYKVNEIVQTAISTVRLRVKEEIELKFESDVDDAFTMVTDARRVQQVLVNYLTNAIKHTDAGHIFVHVSLKEVEGNITFSVADTGAGVPKEKAELVFKRFEKLNAFKQGTGLGLNICRVIADKLSGSCYLDTTYPDSDPDIEHGARFVFTVPLKQNIESTEG